MIRHRIAYVDENPDDILRFQKRVYETLDVIGFIPKPNLDELVEELLDTGAEAFVVDFRLNEYRTAVEGPINYDGADLVEEIMRFRKGFPCFVLTSYDGDAVQESTDVNYVYPKDILIPERQPGQVTFAEKVRIQIEHYQAMLNNSNERFHQLLEKSDTQTLSEKEETELLNLDSFLESALYAHDALPLEKKNELAVGKLDQLMNSTNQLLSALRKAQD